MGLVDEVKEAVGAEDFARLVEHYKAGRISLGELGQFTPAELDNLHVFAQHLIASQQHAEAAEVLRMLVTLDANPAAYWLSLGIALHNQQHWGEAVVAYAAALEREPTNLEAAVYAAECAVELGRPGEALQALALLDGLQVSRTQELSLLERALRVRKLAQSLPAPGA